MPGPLVSVSASGVRPDGLIGALDALSGGGVDQLVADLANAAQAYWIGLAQAQLRSSSGEYERGVQAPEIAGNTASITLVGELPNMIERGASAFDLRDSLCGPGARNRKPILERRAGGEPTIAGWYNTIPFRHGMPGVTGRNFTEIGVVFAEDGPESLAAAHTILSEEERDDVRERVSKAARALGGTVSKPGGGSAWGARLPAGMAPLLRPHHRLDVYAGMVRAQGAYERSAQNTYVTFRRISTRSLTGWQHPGIKARRFAEQVAEFVAKIGGSAVVSDLVVETAT